MICAISLALVAGSFYARAIQDHIDAQEKPSGAINSGLMASKETARRQLSRYLIHKQYKRYRKPSSADSKLVKSTKYRLVLFLEHRTLSDRQERANQDRQTLTISLSRGPRPKARAIDSFKRNFDKT